MMPAAVHHGTLHPKHGAEGASRMDITETSSGFVAPILKLQRPFEDPHFTQTEVDPIRRWSYMEDHPSPPLLQRKGSH